MRITKSISGVTGLQLFQVIRFSGFFITGILLARFNVETAVIGTYEKLMLLAAAGSYFWVQGLLNTMLAVHSEQKHNKSFFFNVFVLLSMNALLVYGLMRLFGGQVIHFISDGYLPGYRMICLYILFNAPCYLIEYIYILRQKNRQLVSYGIVTSIISVGAVAFPLVTGMSVESAIAFLVLWAIVRLLWLLRLLVKYSAPEINAAFLKKMLFLSMPLIAGYLIAGSTDYIDSFMITHFYGDAAFAIYRYGAKELPVSLLLANAVSTAMIPVLNTSLTDGLAALRNQSLRLMHLLFPLSMLLLVISKYLYPALFDDRFTASAAYFNIYLLLVISRTLFPHPIAFAKLQNKAALIISVIEVIFNIIISFSLMKIIGPAGIAIGTVAAHYIEKLLMFIFIYKKYKIHPVTYIPFKAWIIYSLCISLVYIFVTLNI